jgi:hypothetical protein
MLHNIKIIKGLSTELAKKGQYINIVLAAGEVELRARKLNGSVFQTTVVSGMAFQIDEGFSSVSVTSDVNQQTKIWLGDVPLTYSPLELKVVGSSAMQSYGVNLFYNQITEILPARNGRGKLTLQSEKDFRIGGIGSNLNNSIQVAAGSMFEFSTQGAVFGYSTNANDLPKLVSKLGASPEISASATSMTARVDTTVYNPVFDEVISAQENGYYRFPADTLSSHIVVSISGYGKITHNEMHSDDEGFYLFGLKTDKTLWAIYIAFDGYVIVSETQISAPFDGNPGWQPNIAYIDIVGDRFIAFDGYQLREGKLDGTEQGLVDISNAGGSLNSGTINAAGEYWFGYSGNWILTADKGVTWERGVFPTTANTTPKSTVVDGVTGEFYVISGDHLLKSSDGGRTWGKTVVIPENGANAITAINVVGGHIYAATFNALFYYNADAGSWLSVQYDGAYHPINLPIGTNGYVYICSAGGSAAGNLASVAGEVELVGGMQVNVMEEIN